MVSCHIHISIIYVKQISVFILYFKILNGIETCIISYVKRIASPGSMHDTGCSGLVHWDDPEGWDREGSGLGGSGWGTYVHPW